MRDKLIRAGRWILELMYPPTCPFCGHITSSDICGTCREHLTYIEEPRCMRCGKPVRLDTQEYCEDCKRKNHIFDRGYSLWIHSGNVKQAIYQFKYYNKRTYGRIFAEEMYREFGHRIRLMNISVIIPIPISKERRKYRGYNQSELIAEELGRYLEIPVDRKSLIRVKDTAPQKILDNRERNANLKKAFRWNRRERIRGNVLLIDDIYTTGNTIDHASKILKQAGASKVYFLTISIGQGI